MSDPFAFGISDQASLWGLNVVVHATVLTGVSLLIALMFRRAAAMRYWVLCFGLVLVLVSPLISGLIQLNGSGWLTIRIPPVTDPNAVPLMMTPDVSHSIDDLRQPSDAVPNLYVKSGERLPVSGDDVGESTAFVAENNTFLAVPIAAPSKPITPPATPANWLDVLLRFIIAPLILVWTFVTVVLLLRMSVGWLRMSRILRTAKPISNVGLQAAFARACGTAGFRGHRPPQLRVSNMVLNPIAAGVLRGTVILPESLLQQVDPESLADILVHEVAHVVRRDQIVVLLQNLVSAIYWPHPLVRKLNRELAQAREEVCDNFVLAATAAPDYSRTLLSIAQLVQNAEAMPGSVGFFTDRWKLEHRVAGLLDTKRDRTTFLSKGGWVFIATTTISLAALTWLGTITIASAQVQNTDKASATAESDTSIDQRVIQESTQVIDVAKADAIGGNKFGKPDLPTNRITGQVLGADGRLAPEAKLRIVGHQLSAINARIKADDNGRFDFTVRFPTAALGQLRFWAEDARQSEMAFHRFEFEEQDRVTEGIEIKLQPIRRAEVEVVDAEGRPIVDAKVAVQLKYPNILQGFATDTSGRATVKLPIGERIQTVVAFKDQAGLDYRLYQLNRHQQADVQAVAPEFPVGRAERLTLAGATPLTVQTADDDGMPIAGVVLHPWLLNMPLASDSLNLSYFTEIVAQETDGGGSTTFAWFPTWQKQPVTVWPSADGYDRPRGNYDPATGDGTLSMTLHRLVPIRGRVVDAQGKPAEGIDVTACGEGRSYNDFRSSVQTDSTGQYEVLVAPNQNYLLTAADTNRVSAPHTGLVVLPNQPLNGRDFQLRKPTRVHGRLLNESTQEPIPNARVIVYHYGTELGEIEGVELPNPDNERSSVRPIIQHYATTNSNGKFEFQLGDGSFDIRPPQQEKAEQFEIAGEDQLEFTVITKVHAEVELRGQVIAKRDGKPVENADVSGMPRLFSGKKWQASTDSVGAFKVLRCEEATYVWATSNDQSLAGIVELGDTSKGLSSS